MNLWDRVWNRDVYAKTAVRQSKAASKIDIFEENGIDFRKAESLADFGSGGAYVSNEILMRNPNISTVYLVDDSDEALNIAEKNLSDFSCHYKCKKHDMNFAMESSERYYDIVICFSLLEHLNDIEQAIHNILAHVSAESDVLFVWSNKRSVFYLQHKLFEILKIWRYGITVESTVPELKVLLEKEFTIQKMYIVPCQGNKGFLTLLDRAIHKMNKSYGRYVFLHMKKREE